MKGAVFTGFLELVENSFGMEVLQTLLDQTETETHGSYTAVGTYPHQELVDLVISLSKNY